MTKALLERIYALIPQDQTRLVDGAVTVVVLLLLVCLALKVVPPCMHAPFATFL